MSNQKNENVPLEWKTLVLDYLENTTTDEQFQEMRKLIVNPAFQRMLADYAIDQSILRELTRSEELVEGLQGVPESLQSSVGSLSASESSAAKWISSRMAIFAAISAMLLVLITATWSLRQKTFLPVDTDSIQIQSIMGKVLIENRLAEVGMVLGEGEPISTDGVTSFARISYDDGTTLGLAGSSTIVCSSDNGQKLIQVKRGNVSASVSPQPPGKPLLIETDTARMEVVGTNLAISASQASTRLDVTEGKVKIEERSDGSQTDVSAGNYAVADIGKKIEVAQRGAVPSTWKLDFEKGLPEGWQKGTWVRERTDNEVLGNQTSGAVKQAYSPKNGFFSIMSPNAWSEGLFRIHENSYLQYRVKMERPEWYQVMIVTRDGGFSSSVYQGGFEYQEANSVDGAMKDLPPNQWRTIRIPLSSFKRTSPTKKYESIETPFDQRPADPPRIADVVFTVIFDTQKEDRGLVIDDISVTLE